MNHVQTAALLVLSLVIGSNAVAATPAETAIESARERLARAHDAAQPKEQARALVDLAAAQTARARESADAAHYDRALARLTEARALEADPIRCDLVEAWTRLGRHEFETAAKIARRLVEQRPDEAEAWGLLGDALMELSRVEEAGDAYQAMMDRKPGPGAYQRAAFYRERIGDHDGALAFLERALSATPSREREQRAWLHVQTANLLRKRGQSEAATARLEQALEDFPDYHYALAALTELALADARWSHALALAERLVSIAPHAEHFLLLADARRGLGREVEAREAEDEFERRALAHVSWPDNENRHLIDFYLTRRHDPVRAMRVAEREAERRAGRDVTSRR